jgi:hypothetical protein
MMDGLEVEIRRVVVVATNEQQPVVGLGKPLAAFRIKILIIARTLKAEAAVPGHDNECIGHSVLYTALVDELIEIAVNISTYDDTFSFREFEEFIHVEQFLQR